jgi:hypothetical protein
MIKSLYESCSGERLGQDLRREGTAQLFRSNMKRIGCIDDDLALPLLELLRDILVGGNGTARKMISALQASSMDCGDAGPEFFSQRRKRLRSTRVCDCEVYILPRKDACECGANLAGTNNGVLHRDSPDSQWMLGIVGS